MARIRTIKPEFYTNEQVASVAYEWRLLFVGLWLHADREGRLQDRPVRLKAMLFPYDDLDVESGLGCLANAGLIVRYEGDGKRLIAIPKFLDHQRPNSKEPPSELPEHDSARAGLALARQEGKGTEQERNGNGRSTDEQRARFDRFWSAYPRKVGKDAAWQEWLRRSPSDDLTNQMIASIARQRASAQWLKDGGQFIPHPRTWLHQGRWQDEPDDDGPSNGAPFVSPKTINVLRGLQ